MNWRTAKSLLKLRDQIDTLYPGRNKASDGTIGDAMHSAEGTGSDHNPNKDGVVCALDITHDPAHGVDIDKLSDQLAATRDPRIKYIIANSLILCPADNGWIWTDFQGDPHTSHLHISVYGDHDNTKEWNIGEDMMTPLALNLLAQIAWNRPVDGNDKFVKDYSGKDLEKTLQDVLKSKENLDQRTKAANYDKHIAEYKKQLSDARAPVTELDKAKVVDYLQKNLK